MAEHTDEEYYLTEEEVMTYKDHFSLFDKDGDGVITNEEFFQLIKKVHPGIDEDLISEIMTAVDTNRDQVIDFPEFLQLMSQKRQIEQDREAPPAVVPEALPVRLMGEFVGTYILVLTVGCNVLTKNGLWGGTSIGCVLMVMIYALGGACGANFNPAVSFALFVTKKMEANECGAYVAVQIIGGIAAGLTYLVFFGRSFNLAPTPGHDVYQAGIAEIFYTFMLCFAVLNCAASKSDGGKNEYYGLAIGFVVVAGAYGAGSVSMGCFNPAVAFGIDVASAWYGVYYCFLYTFYEIVGALLACAMFWICRPEEYEDVRRDDSGKVIYPLASKLAAEFAGTFMLVLTVGLNVLSNSPAAAFSIAASLMCMIFSLGSVSGANFNPAVTVAIIAAGRNKLKPAEGLFYMVAQLIGGLCAGFVYWCLKNYEGFRLGPQPGFQWWQACYAEFMFTFVLCFVVLSVATTQKPKSAVFGLAIGSCVTVGGFAVGNVSGGSLNPAVSMGIASIGGGLWGAMMYAVVEMLAGVVAAFAFRLTQPSEYATKDKFVAQEAGRGGSHRV